MADTRHATETFCLFMGHTGVGKTSTFNHLFHTKLPVSTETSATRNVDVYTAVARGKRLAFNAVDTAGLEDTSGIHQDACNMHALQKFRKEFVGIGKIPNIILLTVKSTDNRDKGPQSPFVKNIRTLESLKLIDREKRNIVIVVTYACAIPPRNRERKTEEIMKKYQSIILVELGIDVPVVFIENNIEDNGLEKDDQKTGTLLPDGQVQPHNLFQALLNLLNENGDDAAVRSLKAMLNMRLEVRFQPAKSILAKIVDTRNSDNFNLNKDEQLCLRMLQGNSEAHQIAQEQFEQEKKTLEEEMKKQKEENKKQQEEMKKQKEENKKQQEEMKKQQEENKYKCRRAFVTGAVATGAAVAAGSGVGFATRDPMKATNAAVVTFGAVGLAAHEIQK